MPNYRYLIVGGGMTADAAVHGIRDVDRDGSIGLLSAEKQLPYDRPPLTKGLWKGKSLDTVWRHTDDQQVTVHLWPTVKRLDPAKKQETDDEGTVYSYDKLLLATGGPPRHLRFGADQVMYFRTLNDYQRLRELAGRTNEFAVIGGGFIGSEIAAALAMNDKKVK